MGPVALRVVFLSSLITNIMLIVHMLRILLRLVFRSLLVPPILALRLRELVDFRGSESNKEFFGKLVGYGLAWKVLTVSYMRHERGGRRVGIGLGRGAVRQTFFALVVLERLEACEGSPAS